MARPLAVLAILLLLFGAYRYLGDTGEVQNGGALAQVTVPDLTPAQRRGEALFLQNCAACHGENAAGKDGFGPPLVHKIYEPSHHGDMAFVLAVKQGVRQHHWTFGNMAQVDGVDDAQIESIIAYVRALQQANGIH